MKILLYSLIFSIFISDFRILWDETGKVGSLITFIPELIAALLLVLIIVHAARYKKIDIAPKYAIIAALFVIHMISGIVLNSEPAAAVVSGVRIYFKYLPLFLLPTVIMFSDKEMKSILKFVLALAFLQVPVAIYQLLFIFPNTPTGDVIRGTVATGSIMSILLICVIAMVLAFTLRGQIKKIHLIWIALLLFFPTTINETKGTVILLPFALVVLVFFHTEGRKRFSYMVATICASALLLTLFATGYSFMYPDRYEGGLMDFFTEGDAVDDLYKQKGIGEGKTVGRIDSIVYAYNELKTDPTKLAIGLGIGNLSELGISDSLGGEFVDEYAEYGVTHTTFTYLLWEIGLIGIILFLILLYIIFDDARRLRHMNSLQGIVALGWLGVIVVLFLSLIYKNLLPQNIIGYLFLFMSGYISSSRLRMAYRS